MWNGVAPVARPERRTLLMPTLCPAGTMLSFRPGAGTAAGPLSLAGGCPSAVPSHLQVLHRLLVASDYWERGGNGREGERQVRGGRERVLVAGERGGRAGRKGKQTSTKYARSADGRRRKPQARSNASKLSRGLGQSTTPSRLRSPPPSPVLLGSQPPQTTFEARETYRNTPCQPPHVIVLTAPLKQAFTFLLGRKAGNGHRILTHVLSLSRIM